MLLTNNKVIKGIIATGDVFVAGKDKRKALYEEFKAECVEMEGAAVAQVCHLDNIPFIIIRSISDTVNGNDKIDFEKERAFLLNEGYLDNISKPTDKGVKAIEKHSKVIENHAPKRDVSVEGISEQILAAKENMVRNGFKEYEFIANRGCCAACAALNGKHFPISKLKIGVNAPPMHDGCSCSIASYVDRRELDEILDYVDKGGTYEAWNKAKKKKK